MEQFCAHLLPVQQQAISTAQLAGCRFEARRYERDVRDAVKLSREGYPYRSPRWVTTTEYEVFLPDGTSAGTGEDIYECALIALSILNTPAPSETTSKVSKEIFRLDPWNEQK